MFFYSSLSKNDSIFYTSAHPLPGSVNAGAGFGFQAVASDLSVSAIQLCLDKLAEAEVMAPIWSDGVAEVDLLLCGPRVLASLLCSAPSQFTQGMIFSRMVNCASLMGVIQPHGAEMAADHMVVEARAIAQEVMDEESSLHEDWFAMLDDAHIESAHRAVVLDLLSSAPTDFSLGYVYGTHVCRVEMLRFPYVVEIY